MKTLNIKDFRKTLPFIIQKSVSVVIYLKHLIDNSNYILDWDVYLPTKGKNLQRPFVWTLKQKQALILSILKGIKVPSISVIIKDNNKNKAIIFKIIDGKQRLSSMI